MSNQTIPGLPTISQASSAAMMWISDPNASPQDRSLKLGALLGALKFGGILGTNWPAILALAGPRVTISTSGTLGVLTTVGDTDYLLSAATTATLPLSTLSGLAIGQRITFKNLGAFTTAISVSASSPTMYLGGYAKTAGYAGGTFYLYNVDDYVTFEYNGADTWFVVATNGPVQIVNQGSTTTTSTVNAWTAVGNGLSLGSLPPGVYDIELDAQCELTEISTNANLLYFSIGNVITPTGNIGGTYYLNSNLSELTTILLTPISCKIRNYILTGTAIIQAIYFATDVHSTITGGVMTARRLF